MVTKETVVAYCPFTRAYLVRCAETSLLLLSTTQGKHELYQFSFKWEEKEVFKSMPRPGFQFIPHLSTIKTIMLL